MGNMDCRVPRHEEASRLNELIVHDKKSVRINIIKPQTSNIKGDEEHIQPETKREQNSIKVQLKKKTSQYASNLRRKKVVTIKDEMKNFMNELVDDSNYLKRQMKKRNKDSSISLCHPKRSKYSPDYTVSYQLQKMLQQQERFFEDKKDVIGCEFEQRQEARKVKPLQECNRRKSLNNSKRQSFANKDIRYRPQTSGSQFDTIIKKQDEKPMINTQTSNIIQLISHLQKFETGNRSDIIPLTQPNQLRKQLVKQESFQLEIFLDNIPSKLVFNKGDNLDQLINCFIEQHQLPVEVYQTIVQAILNNQRTQ